MVRNKPNKKAMQVEEQEKQGKQTCFVIMPFSDPEGYEKGHFRKIYEQVFKPAIEMAGYEPHRVDDEIESTMIHGKLLNQLVNAPMVLCDLSSKNPNVLYELGIRHAFDLPVVLVQESGQSHIFDIGGITTIDYRKNRLYDEVVEDQRKIADAIIQTAGTKKNYSIMSLAQLEPAKIDKGERITGEARIEIMLGEMNRKITRLEDKLSERGPSITPTYIARQSTIQRAKEQDDAEMQLMLALGKCETFLEGTPEIRREISPSHISDMIINLEGSLRAYRKYSPGSDFIYSRAKQVLMKMQDTLRKELELSTV